jgi:hypothetical protein
MKNIRIRKSVTIAVALSGAVINGACAIPRYEVRYSGKQEWEEISDVELMGELYKFYRKVSPVIKQMISGNELLTPDAVYRLKWRYCLDL